ncbi:MAG TPA: hypothetical protein DFR83_04905 [Deltaproteobacteria bacterium]|nr:hypothetical protein [Deltaproteobacteria bacterium]
MQYWQDGGVLTLLYVAVLILGARQLHRSIPAVRALAVPPVLVAGLLGLLLGGGGLGVLPLQSDLLEMVVYHSLPIIYIAMGLRRAVPSGRPTSSAGGGLVARLRQMVSAVPPAVRSIGLAIPILAMSQGIIGLLVVLAWNGVVGPLHPGVGIMVPLGFSQGPGQALSLGKAWEGMGMVEGAQIGLAMATLGYVFCALFGVAYFHIARWRGWTDGAETDAADGNDAKRVTESEEGGEMERLSVQLAIVGAVYLVVWFILSGVAGLLGDGQNAGMVYGFHFIIALLVALALRKVADRTRWADFADDRLMGRIAGVAVDVGAVCAIAAVRPDRVGSALLPVLLLALVGVTVTVVICLWLARRIFPTHPLSHSLVLFGAMTGTLPTGLALLRLTDPDLSGPAARNMVAGASLSVLFAAPVLLVLLPMPVAGWPESFPLRTWQTVGGLSAYVVVLAGLWWLLGPFRLLRPLASPWPERPEEGAS